ncbi:hypothetical protein BK658_25730 [Pseudomonas brassicacearum]|uniref:Uncharacterized protein n=1 Tax=Pseudomonas brassicacearum TaxID=930166 RepID=A0A423GK79_9PSED|nr:hypothetical protein BK658_25730 [Pseudomonas brassicacearum]
MTSAQVIAVDTAQHQVLSQSIRARRGGSLTVEANQVQLMLTVVAAVPFHSRYPAVVAGFPQATKFISQLVVAP